MIRAILPHETDLLYDGLESFYREGLIAGNPSRKLFSEFWGPMVSSGNGVIYIDERDGVALGAIGGIISPDIYDGKVVATEFFLWVFPGERGSLGVRLLRRFENWAEGRGAHRIRLSTRVSLGDRADRMFERFGYQNEERIYLKEVK